MSVPVAYATMILIWSTTPLGINWSNEAFSLIAALALRMSLAAALGWVLLSALKIRVAWHFTALKTYGYSLLSVYCAMMCVYVSALCIPSGLISVLFALSPPVANALSIKLLGLRGLSLRQWLAFVTSLTGLSVICLNDWAAYSNAWMGIALLLSGVFLYSLSGVMVQREAYQAHPLAITVASLLLSSPLFALTWWIVDGEIPVLDLSSRSIWAIVYLAVIGSLVGFACYFLVVTRLGAIAVAMVTLITPVFALFLGAAFNGESITIKTIVGTFLILLGLVMYYSYPSESG